MEVEIGKESSGVHQAIPAGAVEDDEMCVCGLITVGGGTELAVFVTVSIAM
jgi:hypothetical protein